MTASDIAEFILNEGWGEALLGRDSQYPLKVAVKGYAILVDEIENPELAGAFRDARQHCENFLQLLLEQTGRI